MQASGHRFDPDRLHHRTIHHRTGVETSRQACLPAARCERMALFEQVSSFDEDTSSASADIWRCTHLLFDIVNGFLKSMPRRYGFEDGETADGGLRGGFRAGGWIDDGRIAMGLHLDIITK